MNGDDWRAVLARQGVRSMIRAPHAVGEGDASRRGVQGLDPAVFRPAGIQGADSK